MARTGRRRQQRYPVTVPILGPKKVCSIGGVSCTPGQLYAGNVCGKHYQRMRRHGSYELLCSVGKQACGPQTKLWNGMCRHHFFYAGALPCIESDCAARPTAESNKFVGGRCPKHDQQFRAAERRTGAVCRVGVGCGPQNKLYEGLCRLHWLRWETYGCYDAPVCAVPDCDITADTDPSGRFIAGLCNMHYMRKRHAEERVRDLGLRICPECGGDMSAARRNSKYCSLKCSQAASTARNIEEIRLRKRIGESERKALKLGNPGFAPFTAAEWIELVERVGCLCTYCGAEVPLQEMTMDHIVALKNGGPHALHNITPACAGCNISKLNRVLLTGWAPVLLGGMPRWNKTAPRGKKGNAWILEHWRDAEGPLPAVLERAGELPELMRAVLENERFMAARPDGSLDAGGMIRERPGAA
jgi:5-methylcytosine-specific restriction endonuclease McrA